MTVLKRLNPFEHFKIFPTNHQLFNTTVFMLLGKLVLGITITWSQIIIAMIVGVLTDYLISRLAGSPRKLKHCGSGIVTAFATCVLLRSVNPFVLPAAIFIGVAQKYFFKIDKKHFQNPSNFAVLAALIFFPDNTFLDFKAWGTKYFAISVVIVTAVLLLTRVKLFRISMATFAAYALMNLIFVSSSPLFILNKLTSTTFLLYTFFIINDPMALPRTTKYRLFHILGVLSITFFFELLWGNKDVNIPLGLFLACLLVPFYRRFEDKKGASFYKFLTPASIIIVIVFSFLYNSDLNIKKNLNKSAKTLSNSTITSQSKIAAKADQGISLTQYKTLWSLEAKSKFELNWPSSKVISVENKEASRTDLGFKKKANALSKKTIDLKLEFSSNDFLPYAPIASGDINQDGMLDLVVGSAFGELSIFINNSDGEFLEVNNHIFDEIPQNTEYLALADFNNDTFLDLLVLASSYVDGGVSGLYLFNPKSKKFELSLEDIGLNKKTVGGISLTDINKDGLLDFYISYGVDWHSQDASFINTSAYKDDFYVSENGSWTNQFNEYFDKNLTQYSFAGMTALFVDFDGDKKKDLLLGNDFFDPSFVMSIEQSQFKLRSRDLLAQNTISSMSYFPVDLDSDGEYELWENGVSNKPPSTEHSSELIVEKSQFIPQTELSLSLQEIAKGRIKLELNCEKNPTKIGRMICNDLLNHQLSRRNNDRGLCEKILNPATKYFCIRDYNSLNESHEVSKRTKKFDIEKFPNQLETNVLLKKQTSGKYKNVAEKDTLYSGWSWGAFPFDLDNDGMTDLYITNGFGSISHNTNRLLMNETETGEILLVNKAGELKVDFEDDSRGLIIADLDNDGDGEIILNNQSSSPIYLENTSGGNSIQFELRGKNTYYAYGTKVFLKTKKMLQVKDVINGGIWNSSQPTRLHFGIQDGDEIEEVKILWENGEEKIYKDLAQNHVHYIYQ